MEDRQIAICRRCNTVLARGKSLTGNTMYCLDCGEFDVPIEVYLLEWEKAIDYEIGIEVDDMDEGEKIN